MAIEKSKELISENEFCMFYSICRPEDALCGAEGMKFSSHVMAVFFNLDKYFARFFSKIFFPF